MGTPSLSCYRLLAMTYEQYTPDLAKHERRPQRYSTTNESCTGYSVGLTSQNVLQIHFTAYQSELSAQRDDCPALTVAAKSYQTEQEGRPICTAAHPTVSHLPDSAGEEGLDDAPVSFNSRGQPRNHNACQNQQTSYVPRRISTVNTVRKHSTDCTISSRI